ncbi:MAG: FAD-binding oxidoreductase [Hyphomonas sp.]|uniref:FAD-binding oxidoreductase n=1 Tax=Hyphomonas sp. TaxID=87 RepID=UPI0017DB0697|nr:FAD-binding oxidoreductase [Hyphomonas sp.]MBA3067363.1 FAD-binding oxidoreductase [Hyphomonas sp.]MBU3921119.1 FAD-binding oxidoreductase [Alphaproteobacteria bacterium]MBU4063052.1 FAD-binding oxidoreductase [Alphaproteobacteria bacterium]MBU4163633.1 FAD-binding oxidoreductase [Alphaproteobacteria bacterium]
MTAPLPPAFLAAAKDLLGPKGWSDDPEKLTAAATPWRGTFQGETPFLARPASTAEAAALVKLCAAHRVAMTPQGGNTGLVDGGTPHGEICVSMTRMTAVREVDPFNNSMTIEAGATLVSAQETADAASRLFPLSLGSQGTATLGGLISTNAGGVAVLRYGMMRDLILGLEVVLPSGEVWDGLSGLRKNNTGYDLKHLFAGAEGTLGLITAATFKLFPKVQRATAWVIVASPGDVVKLLALVRDHAGDSVTSFEIIPANAVAMVVADIPGTRDPLPANAEWRVLIEISQPRAEQAEALLTAALEAGAEAGLVQDAAIAASETQAKAFWLIRESIPLSKRAYGAALNQDISVPISRIPAFIDACNAAVRAHAPSADFVIFGHVGDGNLHYSVVEPAGAAVPTLKAHAEIVTRTVFDTVTAFGGSISAEHGVGRLKRDELARLRPPAATQAMRAIKTALDPLNIMNPGRVVSV